MMNIKLQQVDWRSHHPILSEIRHRVFIDEQGVSEKEEWDGLDPVASTIHLLATIDNIAVGTARLLPTGQIGRLCVLKEYRHQTIGSRLLKELINTALEKLDQPIFLNAQLPATPFYENLGFEAEGNVFDDAGIPHRRMSYCPK